MIAEALTRIGLPPLVRAQVFDSLTEFIAELDQLDGSVVLIGPELEMPDTVSFSFFGRTAYRLELNKSGLKLFVGGLDTEPEGVYERGFERASWYELLAKIRAREQTA